MTGEWEEIERRLLGLAAAFERQLPKQDIDGVESLARAGEYGVALENLATQLYEYDIAVPGTVLQEIIELGTRLTVDSSYWTILRVG
ncbi:MAG TPA: MafI family immunity protein [Chloroflexota bacterium]|nr:MafI family immunity protein [Chloroflexota bacterium]